MMASAPRLRPFSRARALDPGIYSTLRRGRTLDAMIIPPFDIANICPRGG